MQLERDIEWIGDPIAYKRPKGSGLIVGKYHYLFDSGGQITSVSKVTRPVLATLLSSLYPDKAMAMAAYVRVVSPGKPQTEEEVENEEDVS